MAWKELTQAANLPINLSDLKAHLRVTHNDEDALLSLYARAAAQQVETRTRRVLITRTFRYEREEFPAAHGKPFELPVAPVVSIEQIQYYNTQGVLTTWASSNYQLDSTSLLGRVMPAFAIPYPSVQSQHADGVKVDFSAGYGSSYAAVPQGLQFVVILLAAHFWTNRLPVEVVGGAGAELPYTLQFAIDTYRILSL